MATILCDFIEISGDAPKPVNKTSAGREVTLPSFKPGGRVSTQTALLSPIKQTERASFGLNRLFLQTGEVRQFEKRLRRR